MGWGGGKTLRQHPWMSGRGLPVRSFGWIAPRFSMFMTSDSRGDGGLKKSGSFFLHLGHLAKGRGRQAHWIKAGGLYLIFFSTLAFATLAGFFSYGGAYAGASPASFSDQVDQSCFTQGSTTMCTPREGWEHELIGVDAYSRQVLFTDGRFAGVVLETMYVDHDRIAARLTSGYGRPCQDEASTIQIVLHSVPQRTRVWCFDDGALVLQRRIPAQPIPMGQLVFLAK